MRPKKGEYYIAWILSSHDQYEAARVQFHDTYDYYSSTLHITYTVGRVHDHHIVIASPASKTDTPTVKVIVNDLLRHFPYIRAGFVVSTDAYVPRGEDARLGDVVIGGKLPDMGHGVVFVDAEKTNKEGRLFMTGESGVIPAIVVAAVTAVRELHRDQVHSIATHARISRALCGVIVSSTERIEDKVAKKIMLAREDCLCFETAASTMRTRPLILLAGISRYCGEKADSAAREWACDAVISYLTRLTQQTNRYVLEFQPAITEFFEYEALDLETPAFRLLKLEGGTGQIQCQVFQACLPSAKRTPDDVIHDETMIIPYEALSYCWGSNKLTEAVSVNGKILHITSNLSQALGFLRLADRDRILWIDAICIDQHDVRERGHQVDIMGRLYSQADEVLIWLGDTGGGIGSLISMLQSFEEILPREARRLWTSEDVRYREFWNKVQDYSFGDENSLQLKLKHLTDNPWFSRVWIIQEVANAKRASMGCTDGWIDARTFAVAPKILEVTPSTQCQAIIDIIPGASRRFSWFRQRPNLSTLLWIFRESQASDSRDKIYALIDISSDKPIAADYSKTEAAIVEEMMIHLSQGTPNFPKSSISRLNEIPSALITRIEELILEGAGLNDLEQSTKRFITPLLLSTKTVDYLRYVRTPLLAQLVHQNAVVVPEKVISQITGRLYQAMQLTDYSTEVTPLASVVAKGRKVWVSAEILRVSRQNGIDFVSTVLHRNEDDIEMARELILEAMSHGPSVLERFLDKYGHKAEHDGYFRRQSSMEDEPSRRQPLRDLQMSFEHAGVFLERSDTLERLIFKRHNERIISSFTSHDAMDIAKIISETKLQNMDATLQAFLQYPCHRKKVIDSFSLRGVHGGQDGIHSYLKQGYYREDLVSKYSVEVFMSSCADLVEIMPDRGADRWKVLIPYRFICPT